MGASVMVAETGLMGAVGNAITSVLGWVGTVLTSLLSTGENAGALSPLLPLFAVGIAISAIMLTVKLCKTFIWGA